ncbi:MAG: GDCCVxC domain-containing (seleno)protein [Wenzhouxiangellaceae bacterium]
MTASSAKVERRSTLECPKCGHKACEEMPDNACIRRYECTACGALLAPLEGDCCVFCSYGDVPCPPVQVGTCC